MPKPRRPRPPALLDVGEGTPRSEKRCVRCKAVKPATDFTFSSATRDGLATYCRACNKEIHQSWYDRHGREHAKSRKRSNQRIAARVYATVDGRAAHMLKNARSRAKAVQVPFDLTRDWVREKLERGLCERTGIQFELGRIGGLGHWRNPFAPSLDRIDPRGGYTMANVEMVVWIYNRAKGTFLTEHVEAMVDGLAAQRQATSKPNYATRLWAKCRARLEGPRA